MILRTRDLNRALLERQLLLGRRKRSARATVEHLVGMQAQNPEDPYVGLWTRLEGFRHEELARLIQGRRAVRIALMRSTLHLVSARDCLAFRPVLQAMLERQLRGCVFGRNIAGLDPGALVAAGRAALDGKPLTNQALGQRLRERWPERDATALGNAIRTLVPLIQVPPRGIWGASGQAVLATAEEWLGRPLDPEPSVERMLLRYLAAFGPATVADMQSWSGMARLDETIARMAPRLRTFHDERGRELFDLPRAPRPDGDTPAPPRFLPLYDNVLLGHADRTRVLSEEARRRRTSPNGVWPAAFLVDGFVAGSWRVVRRGDAATLYIEPFARLARPDRAAVLEEGEGLLAFIAGDARRRDVKLSSG